MALLRRLRRGPSPLADVEYERGAGRLHRWVPSSADEPVREYARRVWELPDAERERARAALTNDDDLTLRTFALRQVLASLRGDPAAAARDGLAAYAALGAHLRDTRDVDWDASLLSWATARAGLDARAEIEAAASRANEEVATALRRYAAEQPSRSEDCLYLHAVHEGEPALLFNWGEEFDPASPLIDLAFGVAEVVERDGYADSSISVGSELPEVWLHEGESPAVQRALAAAGAGAQVSAELDPAETRHAADQSFIAWLLDAGSEANAALIAEAARPSSAAEVLGVSAGTVCCVVTARSYVMRVPSYERPGALERFREPILAVLRGAGA